MSDASASPRRLETTTGSKRKAERLPSCNHCGATLDEQEQDFGECERHTANLGEKGPHQKQKKKSSEDEAEQTEYHWERNASGKRVKVRSVQKESVEAKALFEAEEKAMREREYEEVFAKLPPTDFDAEGQWRRLASGKWEKVEDEKKQEPEWKRIVRLWKERKAAGGTTSGQIVATP
ncbi:hypothetical protein KHU50_003769 [Colletotrichum sp. SAR 10_65]|nr:hypothetical protein K4K51_003289 [Colletotrichum sp. SAR 10_75]KAI8208669.1 hypothetical protein KHU50_003769 [Colletotrichum sp. SAR 10_65]